MNFNEQTYKELKKKFDNEWHKIEQFRRRPLTKRNDLRASYRKNIIIFYNTATSYLKIAERAEKVETARKQIRIEQANTLGKLREAFKLLGLEYTFSDSLFAEIEIEDVSENLLSESEEELTDSESEKTENLEKENTQVVVRETPIDSFSSDQSDTGHTSTSTGGAATVVENPFGQLFENFQSTETNIEETENKMVLEKPTFLGLMSTNIRKNYNGDPLALQPFLASINLLKRMTDDNEELLGLLKDFVLTKLEGIAAEIIPPEPDTIDVITTALKNKLKPESSDVIEGKIMALRADRNNLHEFSTKVEELTDAFRRALVSEQIPLDKAEELTIKRTVQLCRANTNNVTVKAVLTASKFENPKEVVAKFIVESNTTKQEAQILSMRKSHNHGQNYNRNGNFRYHNNGNRYGHNNNGHNNNNNNRFNGNRNGNGRYNNNNNRNGNNTYGNRNQNNNNGNFNRNNNRNNNQNQNRNVRHTENATASQRTLGEAEE